MRALSPLPLLVLLLALGGPPALARDSGDHDRARAAMQAGQIRPLADLLAEIERRYIGQVIETDLDREDGRWVYEFKLLPPTGHVYTLEVDAATGTVLDTDGPVQERR
ncbi:PepSY domain-containing protein [Roseicella aquatilis]|uniref:PepSY domain-containing protein n=1 Tax=Roseicella aquatilis TaxID=2527868 RepID=UPI001404FBEB|nr:PepSY domain-containing protein [Roseicella aquatilis]